MSSGVPGTNQVGSGDPSVEEKGMLTKLKVLAVEDDRIIRRLIRVNLEADGLHVCEADTHLDCLNVVKQQDCGLLLLSREISEEEALQVVGQVREAEG